MKEFVIRYWLEFLFGGAIYLISKKVKEQKCKQESMQIQQEATQNGVKALLRDRIIATYDLHIDKGYMSIYSRENLDEMYKEYKKLKGNGVVDHLIEELNELPTKKRSEK